jgi:hypothetical protein
LVDQRDLDGHLAIVRATSKHSDASLERLRKLYYTAWRRVWSFGVSNAAKCVNQREFLRGYTHIIKSPPARENLCHTIEDLLGGCFDTFDQVNNGGTAAGGMTQDEFVEYVRCWNLSEAEGKQLFMDIAGNGGERISRQQYLLAAWDFYFSMDEQPSPGDNFFGRVRRTTHLTF